MDLASISILDVGHGNCCVLLDDDGVVIVDACLGDTLIRFLEAHRIDEIDAVLVSHADKDHIGGIPSVLLHPTIHVGQIFLNPDQRDTEAWNDLRVALREARTRYHTIVDTALTTAVTGRVVVGRVGVEIVAPEPEIAAGGIGGQDLDGRALNQHALNAVVRLTREGEGLVLLAGDLNATGLENLRTSGRDCRARILVYPHHGGHAGGNLAGFARDLCQLVQPSVIVFSIGRGKHATPRQEVVEAVREAIPDVRIACTQLSEHCAARIPAGNRAHLLDEVAHGKATNSCCAGTMQFEVGRDVNDIRPVRDEHAEFIRGQIPNPLCHR